MIDQRDEIAFRMIEILIRTAHPMAMIDQNDKKYMINSAYWMADEIIDTRNKNKPLGEK